MNIQIGHKKIGTDQPVFIIAELSCNHLQDYDLAVKTIKAMKEAGADAVKVQTYTADTLTLKSDNKYFMLKGGTLWDNKTLHQLYQEAYTPWEWHPKLQKLANKLGMEFFSTPQDETAVDFLKEMDVPAYKIASFEITHLPLIKYVASQGKPILISTGLAKLSDIKNALTVCHQVGNTQIVLFKCTSAYPTPLEEVNLRTLLDMQKRFKAVVGLSDHTMGSTSVSAAVALGAKVIEKHFILDRKLGGPDAVFSMEPTEFKAMVAAVRDTEKALGTVSYKLSPKAKVNKVLMRSLFAVKDIKKGEPFTKENVKVIRPSFGLAPHYFFTIIGKKSKRDIKAGAPLQKSFIH